MPCKAYSLHCRCANQRLLKTLHEEDNLKQNLVSSLECRVVMTQPNILKVVSKIQLEILLSKLNFKPMVLSNSQTKCTKKLSMHVPFIKLQMLLVSRQKHSGKIFKAFDNSYILLQYPKLKVFMLQYIIAGFFLLFTYLFYAFYWKPKKSIEWYRQKFEALGYKVKTYPIQVMGSPVFSKINQDQADHKDCLKTLKESGKYDIVIANFLHKVCIQIVSPQIIKQFYSPTVTSLTPKVSFLTANVRRVLGQGIAFSQGNQWRKKRKIINSVFNFQFLKNCIPKMIETCDQEFLYFQQQFKAKNTSSNNNQFDIYILDIFSGIFSSVMLKCFFGSELSNSKIDGQRYSSVLSQILSEISKQSLQPHALLFGTRILDLGITANDRKLNNKIRDFRFQAQRVIQKRVQQLKERQPRQAYSDIVQALINKNSIRQNMKSEQAYDYRQLIDQFCTFYTAGTDTTSHFLMLIIYYLGTHPKCEQKLRNEVQRLIKSDEDIKDYETLKQLKYIDYLQNQTLRCYGPTVGLFLREAKQDLFIGNLPIKKDTYLGVSFIGNNHNPKNFAQPEQFNPERWQNVDKQLDSFAFIPFSAGARTCIGKQLALLQSKITLIKFVKRYQRFQLSKKDFAMKMKFLPEPEVFTTKLFVRKD